MSRKNPHDEPPPFVIHFQSVLENKLGRLASIRQVKNSNNWWITDPVFSFIQRGLQKGMTGYRVGFFYDSKEDVLAFYLVHSKVMAQIFKTNIQLETLITTIRKTREFREFEHIVWSSRYAKKALNNGHELLVFEAGDLNTQIRGLRQFEMDHEFQKDLFPPTVGKSGQKAIAKGNDFYLLLAEKCSKLPKKRLPVLLEASWNLFCTLYPTEPVEKRSAALARRLISAKIPQMCEYQKISGIPNTRVISKQCVGEVQGAHIKPHAFGGSDQTINGLWLCQYHHRATEGRLSGTRESVNFVYV